MNEPEKNRYSKDSVLSFLGLAFVLFGILLLISLPTRLRYVAYPLFYLLGQFGFYAVSLLFIEMGIHLWLHKRLGRYPRKAVIGLFFLLLGGWLCCGDSIYQGAVDFAARDIYPDFLSASFAGVGSALYGASGLSVGQWGMAFVMGLNSAPGRAFLIVSYSLLMFLGAILVFYPWLLHVFAHLRVNSAVRKSKRLEEEEEEEEFIIEAYEPLPPTLPLEEPLPSKAPSLHFEASSSGEEKEAPSLVSSYSFTKAGGGTLPSRKSLRAHAKMASSRVNEEPEEAPLAPSAPQALPNLEPQSYAARPVMSSGLQEARFVFPGASEQIEPKKVLSASPFPTLTPEPAPSPLPAQPAPVEEKPLPTPIQEEEEQESFAPSFVSPDSFSEEDEDDDSFVPSNNEPIALTPPTHSVITPETLSPKPEPEPEQEPEPEPSLDDDDREGPLPPYTYPSIDLLSEGSNEQNSEEMEQECAEKIRLIDEFFVEFGVGASVKEHLIGPSITRFSLQSGPGVSIAEIGRYIGDLEVRLSGTAIRFVERVPGQPYSALEIANSVRRTVPFKEVFAGLPKRKEGADLHIPFGLDIAGNLKEADLSKFPHMLIAGTSGSGKSIFAHGLLLTLIMRNRPEDLKLVLIDPKRGVEMARYKDLPHLLCPIVKEARPAKACLKKLCDLMDERYRMLEATGTTNIADYNKEYALPLGKKRMPYLVVFIDEFADIVGECHEISDYVLRIAQKARACGIHLIVATQRPDVKVITGTIKSNLLCRVALTVASAQDSTVILGQGGAQDLCGYGDMLIDCQEISKREFVRAQGCFTNLHEGKAVCDFVRGQMAPHYDPDFMKLEEDEESGPELRDGGYAPVPSQSAAELKNASNEDKYQYIKSVIMTREYCSISLIQREFEVGFPRAGKILARLQSEGIVASPGDAPNNSKGCRVIKHEEDATPPDSL